ncbi:MAG: hypothetical protein U0939_14785 [Pirellulales bacterium]
MRANRPRQTPDPLVSDHRVAGFARRPADAEGVAFSFPLFRAVKARAGTLVQLGETFVKRTGFDHPKVRRLAGLLGIRLFEAIGLLECLWHFTARHAICGDVGKWSDDEIAVAIDWPIDRVSELIDALVSARLVDPCPVHRLVIHDWQDHADDSTRKTIKKHGWNFVVPVGTTPAGTAAAPAASPTNSPPLARAEETADGNKTDDLDAVREHSGTIENHSGMFSNSSEPFRIVPDSHSQSQSQSDSQSQSQAAPPAKKCREVALDPKCVEFAQFMWHAILALHPAAREPDLEKWADELRIMCQRDGPDRTLDEARALFAWANQDAFWRTNILSPGALRKHWDKLKIKRDSNGRGTSRDRRTVGKPETDRQFAF